MFVIVTEAVSDRLKGFLSRLLLQVRAGVFVGTYNTKVRENLWAVARSECSDGNMVMIWETNNESGFDFESFGNNVRVPAEFDGMKLVKYCKALPVGNDGKNDTV